MPTVNRAEALVGRIARLGAEPARREAVSLGLVDALLERDHDTLAAALQALRDARADGDPELVGWLDAAIAFAHWGLERVPSQAAVAQGTQAHEFLAALDGSPRLGSTELRRLLEVDETQVSRTGRRLLETGLVTRRKVGRQAYWELTPRGQRALEEAPKRSSNSEFWQEALRRGFDTVYGDEPGDPRQVDPTRERIIVCTLELHTTQGHPGHHAVGHRGEVGRAGGDPGGAVPHARRPGAKLRPARHGEPAAAAARPGGARCSPAPRLSTTGSTAWSRRCSAPMSAERTASRPRAASGRTCRPSTSCCRSSTTRSTPSSSRRCVRAARTSRPCRALTDLEVWRSLRHQGATPEAAVDEASAAVERWLAAR